MRGGILAGMMLAVAVPVTPVRAQADADPAEAVRAAERAFARSMAARDLEAFAAHVAADAIFIGRNALRGKAAVVEGWAPFFEGAEAPFSWEPEVVEVLEDGTLALSSGPVWDPAGNRIGTFNSIWRREADGRWRVIFDKGCPPCACGEGR